MKNNKVVAVIYWIISLGWLLAVLPISDGGISKRVIVQLGLAVCWFIMGFIYWKKARKKEE